MNITIDGVTRPMTENEKQALEQARHDYEQDIKNGKIILRNEATERE